MAHHDEPEIALQKLMDGMPMIIKRFAVVARLHREKYDALLLVGFNEQQALELCKVII